MFEMNLFEVIDQKLVIYGAGGVGKKLLGVLNKQGLKVQAFLDQRSVAGMEIENIKVYHPDIFPDILQNAVVLIAVHNRDADVQTIIVTLIEKGFKQILTPVMWMDFLSKEMGDLFWLTTPAFYSNHIDEIKQGENLWADEASRSLYNASLTMRTTGDYGVLPAPDFVHQYFPLDIPAWQQPIRLLDGGAFDGDTMLAFQTAGLQIESIAAFEPDVMNFQNLAKNVKKHFKRKAFLFPCGLWSSTVQLAFTMGSGEASHVEETASSMIQVVKLDDVLFNFQPNLIKMDIEGAELNALNGAYNMICDSFPGLAISIYHQPAHIWEIPLLLQSWNLGYSFYLRSHGYNNFESVLYAIPGEK
jgi:FkbM family methyltransferase